MERKASSIWHTLRKGRSKFVFTFFSLGINRVMSRDDRFWPTIPVNLCHFLNGEGKEEGRTVWCNDFSSNCNKSGDFVFLIANEMNSQLLSPSTDKFWIV